MCVSLTSTFIACGFGALHRINFLLLVSRVERIRTFRGIDCLIDHEGDFLVKCAHARIDVKGDYHQCTWIQLVIYSCMPFWHAICAPHWPPGLLFPRRTSLVNWSALSSMCTSIVNMSQASSKHNREVKWMNASRSFHMYAIKPLQRAINIPTTLGTCAAVASTREYTVLVGAF